MTDRFTPGPWRVDALRHAEVTRVLHDVQFVDGLPKTQYRLADITYPSSGYGTVGERERDANARLVAAAPELLEACRRLLGWSFWDQGGSAGRDAEFARAAIRRATGEKEQEARDVTD